MLEPFDLLHLDECREELADLVSQLRVAVGVLVEGGPLAAAEPRGKLLGKLVEPIILP